MQEGAYMPGKIRALKIIYQVLAILALLGVVLGVLVILTGGILGGLFMKDMERKGYEPEEGDAASAAAGGSFLAGIFGLPVVIFGIILFILYLLIARGIARKRGWAKVLVIISGILMLPSIPVGTILGIFILLNISSDQSKVWFGEMPASNAVPA
jgi:hypothetical protein